MTELNRKDNIQNYDEDDLLNMLFSGKYQVEQPVQVIHKPDQQPIIHKPIGKPMVEQLEEKTIPTSNIKHEQLVAPVNKTAEPQKVQQLIKKIQKIIASNDKDTVLYSDGTLIDYEYKKYGGRAQTRSYYTNLH